MRGKVALVTGASSGIGEAVAKRLAREGLRVVLVARRRSRLEALAKQIRDSGGQALALEADLAQEADRKRVFQAVNQQVGAIDVLVNNAGLGWYGYGHDMPWKIAREMLQVNVGAVVQLTIAVLPQMRRRGTGHIINIGSISGNLPSQGVALYGATKSFLDNFTTALYRELTGTPVHISVVRLGAVRTEFGDAALLLENGRHVPTENIGLSAERVADGVWSLIRRPRRVIYIPYWLRIVPWLELTFGWIIDRVGALLLRKSRASQARGLEAAAPRRPRQVRAGSRTNYSA